MRFTVKTRCIQEAKQNKTNKRKEMRKGFCYQKPELGCYLLGLRSYPGFSKETDVAFHSKGKNCCF